MEKEKPRSDKSRGVDPIWAPYGTIYFQCTLETHLESPLWVINEKMVSDELGLPSDRL